MLIGCALVQYVIVFNVRHFAVRCVDECCKCTPCCRSMMEVYVMISSFVTQAKSAANSAPAVINDRTLTPREWWRLGNNGPIPHLLTTVHKFYIFIIIFFGCLFSPPVHFTDASVFLSSLHKCQGEKKNHLSFEICIAIFLHSGKLYSVTPCITASNVVIWKSFTPRGKIWRGRKDRCKHTHTHRVNQSLSSHPITPPHKSPALPLI